MRSLYGLLASLSMVCLLSQPASGDDSIDWPGWRGGDASGSIQQGRYPIEFGGQNYHWRTELPGKGCSTPITFGQSIYLTAPVEDQDALLCFGTSGNERWRTVFGPQDPGKHRNGSGSNASPVTDGQAVFVYFKSGTFAAVELNGQVRWQQDIVAQYGKEELFWDHGTSPILTDNYVILARMHGGDSWLAAFDKQSGRLAWKTERNYQTPVECDQGYTTPLRIHYAGQEAILVWGAEHITLHDAAEGKLMWSCGNFNPQGNKLWPAIASPIVVDGVVVVAYGRNDRHQPLLFGVQLSGEGDVTDTNHIWMRDDVGTFVPTPLVHGNRVLIVGDQGEVECLDPKTGQTVWKDALPKHRTKFYASPLLANQRLYAAREDGTVFVASVADDQFRLLAENQMEESVIGSPIPLGNGILIRGENHLFYVSAER